MSEVLEGAGMTTQEHAELKGCLNRIAAALKNVAGWACGGTIMLTFIAAASVTQCAVG